MDPYIYLVPSTDDSESSPASFTASSDESHNHSPTLRRQKKPGSKVHLPPTSPGKPAAVRSRYQSSTNSGPNPGTWNIHYAVAHLLNYLRTYPTPPSPSPKRTTATESPSTLPPGEAISATRRFPVSSGEWRSYPSLIFASLSASVFGGLIDEHIVKLTWTDLDSQVSGRTAVLVGPGNRGTTGDGRKQRSPPKVKIELNAAALQGASRDEIVGTLLHHMIHAYLVVVCEDTETRSRYHSAAGAGVEDYDDDDDDDRLSHGNAFAAVLWELRAQAARHEAQGERALPVGFGHRLPGARLTSHDTESPPRGSNTGSGAPAVALRPDRHPRCSTRCPVSVPVIGLDAASRWYTAACAPLLAAPAWMRRGGGGGGDGKPRTAATAGRFRPVSRDSPTKSPRTAVFADGTRCWVELPRGGEAGTKWGENEVLDAPKAFLSNGTYGPATKRRARWRTRGVAAAAAATARGGRAPVISDDFGAGRCCRRHRRRDGDARSDTRGVESESNGGGGDDADEEEGGEEEEGGKEGDDRDDHGEDESATETTHHQHRLLHDLRIYRLAHAIGFSELATYAIRCVHAHTDLSPDEDDPIELLEAIYFPSDNDGKDEVPPQELRCWTRKFLSRCDDEDKDEASMVSNMTKLQTRSHWKKRWKALLARGGEQGRALHEDVTAACVQDAAGSRRRRRRRQQQQQHQQQQHHHHHHHHHGQQSQGMRHVGYHDGRQPWSKQEQKHVAAADGRLDVSSASADNEKPSRGNDSVSADAKKTWPNNDEHQFNRIPEHGRQGGDPQPPPMRSAGYAPPFFPAGWWSAQNYLAAPYQYPCPFTLSPSPAPFFQYCGPAQSHALPHEQVRPQKPYSACENSASVCSDAAADTAATPSPMSTRDMKTGCSATSKGSRENELGRTAARHTASDGTRRRRTHTGIKVEWRRRAIPQRRRHSNVTQPLRCNQDVEDEGK